MKIITYGRNPLEDYVRRSCGKCGTVIEAQIKEFKEGGEQRDGYYQYINCPLEGCSGLIYL